MPSETVIELKQSLELVEPYMSDAELRRDKGGAVIRCVAMTSDAGVAWVSAKARPFVGDTLSQDGNEWVVEDVSGWGDVGLWTLGLGDAQPRSDRLAAPSVEVRRIGDMLRVEFPHAPLGSVANVDALDADGGRIGDTFSNVVVATDRQVVINPIPPGAASLRAWLELPSMAAETGRAAVEVPSA